MIVFCAAGLESRAQRVARGVRWLVAGIARAVFPDPPGREKPSPDQLEKSIGRYEELSRTVRRTSHTLLATELFCLVTLSVPDSRLVLPDSVVTLPIIQLEVSFAAFLVVGPALVIGLTVYLHVFYGALRRNAFPGVERLSSVHALYNLDSLTAQERPCRAPASATLSSG